METIGIKCRLSASDALARGCAKHGEFTHTLNEGEVALLSAAEREAVALSLSPRWGRPRFSLLDVCSPAWADVFSALAHLVATHDSQALPWIEAWEAWGRDDAHTPAVEAPASPYDPTLLSRFRACEAMALGVKERNDAAVYAAGAGKRAAEKAAEAERRARLEKVLALREAHIREIIRAHAPEFSRAVSDAVSDDRPLSEALVNKARRIHRELATEVVGREFAVLPGVTSYEDRDDPTNFAFMVEDRLGQLVVDDDVCGYRFKIVRAETDDGHHTTCVRVMPLDRVGHGYWWSEEEGNALFVVAEE